ncbi:TPA: competence protein CoiA [Salmonella enterica]
MLTAMHNGKIIIARDAQKPGIFTCPECGEPVTLRKGSVKIHHFAHRNTMSCGYGKGESELHMDLKMRLYDALLAHPDVTGVALEAAVGRVRPDVLAVIRGQQVAFEIQLSSLSIEDLYRRTAACAAQDIAMIWILSSPEKTILSLMYRLRKPSAWERWLNTCGLGCLYFWASGGWVRPIRLGNRQHGLQKAPRAHLVDDFEPKRIGGWKKGDFLIPARFIWNRKKINI